MASGVDARLLKSTKFPPEFSQKVDMQKVNVQIIKKWIASRISEILGTEDDVIIELCYNLIEGQRNPDIKALQIQLTGFLEKDTPLFCKQLWNLLLSAQASPQGVPKELLEAKKLELIQEKLAAERAAEDARKRRDDQDRHDREISDLKDRDRRDRGDRGRGQQRGGRRGDRGFDRGGRGAGSRPVNRSRSPDDRLPQSRDSFRGDSYNPRGRPSRGGDRGRDRGRDGGWRRGRSPSRSDCASTRSSSRSRSRNQSLSSDRSGRLRNCRKRSRSRTERNGAGGKDRYGRTRRSRSSSSRRSSPVPKRRRYSSSRSRSVHRRRRRSYSSASSSRSRSRSRSASRGRHSLSDDSRGKSSKNRHRQRHRSVSTDGGDDKWRRDRSPREHTEKRGPRRNSSSASPPPPVRGKSADILEDAPRAAPSKPNQGPEKEDQEVQTNHQRASILKEQLLRQKIMRMRSSAGGSNNDGQS